ncbi:hypothetical protein BHE74_00048566 [Ensete ventricosum]|nr:hypothetical protein GW17_00044874 [Ensete ventricosum]RWW45579.1 hypothetical protein BHE74_00048566 [Ensete ventricosum]RZR89780.1 hypothetical protein BHM03_00017569 [Ensete ventricosum]
MKPSSSLSFHLLLLLLLLPQLLVAVDAGGPQKKAPYDDGDQLGKHYYARSCPSFEAIVGSKIAHWHSVDPTLSPGLIRLHFHDCAVRGCDASILLDNPGGERRSPVSATLRGFHVIDDIKAEIERRCPKTVSCADILVAAARDATLMVVTQTTTPSSSFAIYIEVAVQVGGPYWGNVYGRRDGRVSIAQEAEALPEGRESITHLIDFFESLGLDILDLVVLSGAHTVGRATCQSIEYRLYNYTGVPSESDPSINPRYLNYLKRKCRRRSAYVDLDATTPTKFDNAYYRNLNNRMGLLSSDQLLRSDSRTGPLVEALSSQPMVFVHQFARSMKNLADTMVLEGDEGEIRTNCNFVNEY